MRQKVNDVTLFYEITGNGHPLVLLHGNSEDHTIFDKVVEALGKHYTVYAVDSRCHGQSSDSGVISYQLMADDIVAFIAALGLEKPYLFGFSDGAIVALLIASQQPKLLSKLVAAGATSSATGMKKRWTMLFRLSYFFKRDKLFQMVLTQPQLMPEELGRIVIPTLLLFGEKDITKRENVEYMAKAIPGAQLTILPKENHMSYVVHSEKLYPLLDDFFTKNQ